MSKISGKYNLSKLKKEWDTSVGNASGLSFEVALLLADNPEDIATILSSSEESMEVLASVKKQYEKSKRLLQFAKKFRKVIAGHGAFSEDEIDAMRKARGSSPANMRGLTEHFPKTYTHNQFNYIGRTYRSSSEYPIVTAAQAAQYRESDEKQRIAASSSMSRAEMAFHATRFNKNWDDYLTGRTGDWSGYDPSSGPLGDIVRSDIRKERMDRARGFARSEIERYESEDLEKQRKERADSLRDSRLRDSRNSIAVRRRQLDAYRRFPWMKTLVDSGIVQKKNLPMIAKSLKKIEKTPVIGNFVKHPAAMAALAGIGVTAAILNESDKANKTVTGWSNAKNFFGTPPKAFSDLAHGAGMVDPSEQAKLWGKLTMTFGDPMNLKYIGKDLATAPSIVRMGFANKYGLSQEDMAVIDVMSGEKRGRTLATEPSRITDARVRELEKIATMGLATGSTPHEELEGLAYSVPLAKSIEARTGWYSKYIVNPLHFFLGQKLKEQELLERTLGIGNYSSKSDAARSAANSLDRFNAGGFLSSVDQTTGMGPTNTMAVYISNFNAQTNNVDQLKQSLIDEARGHDRLGVAEAMDTRIKR